MQYFRLPCGFLLVEWDLGEGAGLGFGVSWLEEEALQQLPHVNHNRAGVSASVSALGSCCQDRMGDGPAVSPSWLLACQCVQAAGPELLSARVAL